MSAMNQDDDLDWTVDVPRTVRSGVDASRGEGAMDIENIIFQALVNEGKHLKVINTRKQPLSYNEKELREAAHAEVAVLAGSQFEESKNSKKRKNLDTDEKAQQSRDRNREHAKFTRLRKKAYVGKLKDLLDEMKNTTEGEEAERRTMGEKIYETQLARKEAVRLFLDYRGAGVRIRDQWTTLLDDNVTLTLPITPYRSFHRSDITNSSRVVRGVDAVMADAASLSLLAEGIGLNSAKWKSAIKRNAACKIEYVTRPDDVLAAGESVMCRYTLQIRHCDTVGGAGSCVQHGMLQCKFDQLNKITSAEMMFDVMGFMQQLQMCWGISPENSIVPNTVDGAMQPSKDPCAILSATHPPTVLHANEPWKGLCGLPTESAEQRAEGTLVNMLRVYDFQRDLVTKLAAECGRGMPGSAIFLSHNWREMAAVTKSLKDVGHSTIPPLVYYIKMLPLTSDSDTVTHILASLVELPLTEDEGRAAVEKARIVSQAMRVAVSTVSSRQVNAAPTAVKVESVAPNSTQAAQVTHNAKVAPPPRATLVSTFPVPKPAPAGSQSGYSIQNARVQLAMEHHRRAQSVESMSEIGSQALMSMNSSSRPNNNRGVDTAAVSNAVALQMMQQNALLHPHPAAHINPQPFYYYPQNALIPQQQPAPVAIYPGMFGHFPGVGGDMSVHTPFPAGLAGYAPGMYLSAEALRRRPSMGVPLPPHVHQMPDNVANNIAQLRQVVAAQQQQLQMQHAQSQGQPQGRPKPQQPPQQSNKQQRK